MTERKPAAYYGWVCHHDGARRVLAVNDDHLVDWGGPLNKIAASHSMFQIKYLALHLYGHR
jgi:hypothetical protein